jgi:hypothetical protein
MAASRERRLANTFEKSLGKYLPYLARDSFITAPNAQMRRICAKLILIFLPVL